MKILLKLTFFMSLLVAGTFAEAATLGNYIGCTSEKALDQLFAAMSNNDSRLQSSLMGSECVPVGGREFSVIDRGFVVTEVRVYVGENSIDLFVPSEAVR